MEDYAENNAKSGHAASGMGLATVKRLVKIGWNVAIVDFDKDKGTAAAAQLGDQAIFIHTNVARYEDQVSAFRQVWGKWGHIDLGMWSPI